MIELNFVEIFSTLKVQENRSESLFGPNLAFIDAYTTNVDNWSQTFTRMCSNACNSERQT